MIADEDVLICRHVIAWHAYLEGGVASVIERLDLEEQFAITDGLSEDEAYGPVDKRWYAFLDARQFEVRIDLIDRLRRHTDGSVPYLVHRALERLAEELEAAEDEVLGSTAQRLAPTQPPAAADPASPTEARALAARWLASHPGSRYVRLI